MIYREDSPVAGKTLSIYSDCIDGKKSPLENKLLGEVINRLNIQRVTSYTEEDESRLMGRSFDYAFVVKKGELNKVYKEFN